MVEKKKSKTVQLTLEKWYNKLVEDCKAIVTAAKLDNIKWRHRLGMRILKDELNFKRAGWGEKYIEKLSNDLEIHKRNLWYFIKFAKKFPNYEEIVNRGSQSWKEIRGFLPEFPSDKEMERWMRVYNVWNFAEADDKYGKEYPGRIPGQLVKNVLRYWTKEGDLVIDPMAGGGVVNDVCVEMNRKCLSYDLHPSREFIKKNDISKGFPKEVDKVDSVDLIFLDPPYWDMKKDDYKEDSVSGLSLKEFYSFIEQLAKDCFKTVKKGGKVTYLMMPMLKSDGFEDLSLESYKLFEKAGFKLIQRISAPLITQQFKGFDVKRAKKIFIEFEWDYSGGCFTDDGEWNPRYLNVHIPIEKLKRFENFKDVVWIKISRNLRWCFILRGKTILKYKENIDKIPSIFRLKERVYAKMDRILIPFNELKIHDDYHIGKFYDWALLTRMLFPLKRFVILKK